MPQRTLYDVLGVAPDAATNTIRQAYRRAARANHPDMHGEQSAARMAEINHAWTVLGDAARRREYDLQFERPDLRAPSAAPAEPVFVEPRYNPLAQYQDPPRVPWKLMAWLAVAGVVFVLIGVATASDPAPPAVDNVLREGDCVAIEPNGDAAERLCTEPHDGTMVVMVQVGDRCPEGTEAHRDRQGLGTACVRLD
ncbi:MAG: DnaJ domain-containing protein [Actinomycetota bacterium]|nr:DnaJ domain-containing protein [Actinomycetota bacterium]